MVITLGQLAERIGAQLEGDPERRIHGVGSLLGAGPEQLTFLASNRYRGQLAATRAGAVILRRQDAADCPVDRLINDNPYLSYARAAASFVDQEPLRAGRDPSAVIDPSAEVSPDAQIGALVAIGAGTKVAHHSYIGPGCVIGRGVTIGTGCRLVARVTICDGSRLGDRVLAQPGAVIGSDGFGHAHDGAHWVRIPQLGAVTIGDDVEIGANTTIDRGAIEDTVVESGVKLDNLVQVGHNVHIGSDTAVAGCVGIAGSTRIGRHCRIGGGAGFKGHIEVADGVQVSFMTAVSKSLLAPGSYASTTLVEPQGRWRRNCVRFRKLDELARRLISLERRFGTKEDKQ